MSILSVFLTFGPPDGVPGGAEMGPEIGEIRISWKSEKCPDAYKHNVIFISDIVFTDGI